MEAAEAPPNQTLYVNNLYERLKKDGARAATLGGGGPGGRGAGPSLPPSPGGSEAGAGGSGRRPAPQPVGCGERRPGAGPALGRRETASVSRRLLLRPCPVARAGRVSPAMATPPAAGLPLRGAGWGRGLTGGGRGAAQR